MIEKRGNIMLDWDRLNKRRSGENLMPKMKVSSATLARHLMSLSFKCVSYFSIMLYSSSRRMMWTPFVLPTQYS